jgi:hypothetical protein
MAYWIFAIVLTIAYIIYYGYNISKDIYGKKTEKTNAPEVFDIKSLASEVTATPVKEVDGGFSFGDNVVDSLEGAETDERHSSTENKLAKVDLDEADVQSEGGMFEAGLLDWMVDHSMDDSSSDAYRKSTINEQRQIL